MFYSRDEQYISLRVNAGAAGFANSALLASVSVYVMHVLIGLSHEGFDWLIYSARVCDVFTDLLFAS